MTVREIEHLLVQALRESTGLDDANPKSVETQRRGSVGAARLQAVADFLGVPVSTVFDETADAGDGCGSIQHLLQDRNVMSLVRTFARRFSNEMSADSREDNATRQ